MMFGERLVRYDSYLSRDAISQWPWDFDPPKLSLLSVISPEALEARRTHAVPADVMPFWAADALEILTCQLPAAFWPEFLTRFRVAFETFRWLSPANWTQIEADLRNALLQRFTDNPRKHPGIREYSMAQVIYFLPDNDGSHEFFAECFLRFIHAQAHA
jgi:hypothetical protein